MRSLCVSEEARFFGNVDGAGVTGAASAPRRRGPSGRWAPLLAGAGLTGSSMGQDPWAVA